MKYAIQITEKLVTTVEVEATTRDEALQLAQDNYCRSGNESGFEEYVLTSENYNDTDFSLVEDNTEDASINLVTIANMKLVDELGDIGDVIYAERDATGHIDFFRWYYFNPDSNAGGLALYDPYTPSSPHS